MAIYYNIYSVEVETVHTKHSTLHHRGCGIPTVRAGGVACQQCVQGAWHANSACRGRGMPAVRAGGVACQQCVQGVWHTNSACCVHTNTAHTGQPMHPTIRWDQVDSVVVDRSHSTPNTLVDVVSLQK